MSPEALLGGLESREDLGSWAARALGDLLARREEVLPAGLRADALGRLLRSLEAVDPIAQVAVIQALGRVAEPSDQEVVARLRQIQENPPTEDAGVAAFAALYTIERRAE